MGSKKMSVQMKKTKKNRHFSSEHADLVCPSSGETSEKRVKIDGFSLAPAIKCTFGGKIHGVFEVSFPQKKCLKRKRTFCSMSARKKGQKRVFEGFRVAGAFFRGFRG